MLSRRISGPKFDQGFAVVEMAIASAVLVLIVFASLEGGLILYDQGLVSAASREAARAGIVLRSPPLSDQKIKELAEKVALNYVDPANNGVPLFGFGVNKATATATPLATDGIIGKRLKVEVRYEYKGLLLLSLLNLFSSQKMSPDRLLPIVGVTTMYME